MFRLGGQFVLMLHCLHFSRQGILDTASFDNECILNVCIKIYMRCLYQC